MQEKLRAAHEALRAAQLESTDDKDYPRLDDIMFEIVDLYEEKFGDF